MFRVLMMLVLLMTAIVGGGSLFILDTPPYVWAAIAATWGWFGFIGMAKESAERGWRAEVNKHLKGRRT